MSTTNYCCFNMVLPCCFKTEKPSCCNKQPSCIKLSPMALRAVVITALLLNCVYDVEAKSKSKYKSNYNSNYNSSQNNWSGDGGCCGACILCACAQWLGSLK